MEYRVVNKVRKEELKRTNILTSEYIYRKMITKLVNEMPMDALERVFELEKIDYEDKEVQTNYKTGDPWYRSKVDRLRSEDVVKYKVKLKTPQIEVQYNQLIELNKDRL